MSEAAETPVRNPDDGQDHVDPCVSATDHNLTPVSPRAGSDPVNYGPRSSSAGHFDPPRSGGGGSHFDPPGGGGGSYSDIF